MAVANLPVGQNCSGPDTNGALPVLVVGDVGAVGLAVLLGRHRPDVSALKLLPGGSMSSRTKPL